MPLPIFALFLAAFAIGTAEFVIAGLLPEVSTDLGVTIPTAGLLISAYAIGVAIGGPLHLPWPACPGRPPCSCSFRPLPSGRHSAPLRQITPC